MTNRIERLKQALNVEDHPLCLEKSLLWTESYKQSEGEATIVRRARAFANILDNITIFIEDDELIVGNTASKPMGFEISFWAGIWPQDEIEGLKEEGYNITPEDEDNLVTLREYWKGKTLTDKFEQYFDEERMWPFMETPVILPPWKRGVGWAGYAESGMGLGPYILVAPDYEMALSRGLEGIIADSEQELKNTRITNAESIRKFDFLKAVIIAHKAAIRFSIRFADLAKRMAEIENNPTRKKDLLKIENICRWIPAHSPRDFHEALQFFWFLFLMFNPNGVVGMGRFDQYMYPFYKKTREAGLMTDEEVLELLQCLRIKDMQLIRTSSREHRKKWSGMAKWHNCIISGQTPDGKDATNDLSYLILEAASRCRTPHHTITLRVHEGTPEPLMTKALELVRTGIGMPAFVGDRSYIDYLLQESVPLVKARNYTLVGCLDVGLPGESRTLAVPMFIVPLVLEITLNNGIFPGTGKQLGPNTGRIEDFKSFEELLDAFKKQIVHFTDLAAEHNNIKALVWSELFPDPLLSSLMKGAIKDGKALLDRKFDFENIAALSPVGMINAADSLAAVKKLVFEEKKLTLKELKQALDTNWAGDRGEEIRKMVLAAPKYGNDDDYVDSIVKEIYGFWTETVIAMDNYFGGKHKSSGVSISAQWPGGAVTGATPDGRFAGECLADGSVSAMRGKDTRGPTALLKSAMKIDQTSFQATLLNVKFHPSAMKTAEDLQKLSMLIRTYFIQGGKHIQFNVVDKETLTDAQDHPDNHGDLIVRIAGYSAYFVQLDKVMQDEIVARTEYDGMG